MHTLGHIISVVSWSHWVFWVLQETASSRRPDRGLQGPGLCPRGMLLPPRLSPPQPEPSGGFFCCLHVVTDGSSSVCTCYAQCAVGFAQGMAGKSPTAHLHWHTPGPPPVPQKILHHISPSFFLEPPPSSPPREPSAPARRVVLWPLRLRSCQVSIWTG